MSSMFAVDDNPPHNPSREALLTTQVSRLGGRQSFRETPEVQERGPVCLTDEFAEIVLAEKAADALRQQGEHVAGPRDSGL